MPEFPIPSARILLVSQIQGGRLPPPAPLSGTPMQTNASQSIPPEIMCILECPAHRQRATTKEIVEHDITSLGAPTSKPLPNNLPSAQDFLDFFNKKVEGVREGTGQGPATTFLPPAAATLNCFQLYTEADVAKVITAAPSKSCELDPIPTDILRQFLPVLLPYITKMCNASLKQGILPTTQRSTIVTPRLKKAGSDPADVRDYRPISNLTFMSKVVERLVCRQLVAYLEQNGLLPDLQSAYRRCRLTETAVLKVVADLFTAADRGEVTLLILLDLSAAFDTVDRDMLINRLYRAFGFRDDVLSWITSFVTGHAQRVHVGGQYSTYSAVQHGVPQGSVLGLILFLL